MSEQLDYENMLKKLRAEKDYYRKKYEAKFFKNQKNLTSWSALQFSQLWTKMETDWVLEVQLMVFDFSWHLLLVISEKFNKKLKCVINKQKNLNNFIWLPFEATL